MKAKKIISAVLTIAIIITSLICANFSAVADNGNTITVNAQFNQTEARTILNMINEFRTSDDAWYWNDDNETITKYESLNELKYDYRLEEIAMQRAVEIAIKFSHTRPNGKDTWSAYTENGVNLITAVTCGENIASGHMTAGEVHNDWREDFADYEHQGHRRNLLSSKYKTVGIGHAYYNGTHFWVEEFAGSEIDTEYKAPFDGSKDYQISVSDTHTHIYEWISDNGVIVKKCTGCGDIISRLPFKDLSDIDYRQYSDYIEYTSVNNQFITGTNPPERTLFSPTAPITRAMFVTILYRMAGEPYKNANPYLSTPFTDITDTSVYYYDAACWALKNGITTETTFKPFDNVSREQTASFLFRYAKDNDELGDDAYKNVNLAAYPDYNSVHGWAVEAMQWANYNGMITGTQQGYINPQGATQRIHATKILYGFGKTCNIGNFG